MFLCFSDYFPENLYRYLLGDTPKFANKKVYMRKNSVCILNAQKHKNKNGSGDTIVNRLQGLEKKKEGTFKNLGLVAAQCNGIAACAYSLKIFTVLTYVTVHILLYMVSSIKTYFYPSF